MSRIAVKRFEFADVRTKPDGSDLIPSADSTPHRERGLADLLTHPLPGIRLAGVENHLDKRAVLLPTLYRLSDPAWEVRGGCAKIVFDLLVEDKGLKSANSSSGAGTSSYPKLTLDFLVRYGVSPVVANSDPAYRSGVTGISSDPEVSRTNARLAVMRVMQLIADPQVATPATDALYDDLKRYLLAEAKATNLKELIPERSIFLIDGVPKNPLGTMRKLSFVSHIQAASRYYSALGQIDQDSESMLQGENARRYLLSRGSIGAVGRSLRAICRDSDELKRYFLAPSDRECAIPADFRD